MKNQTVHSSFIDNIWVLILPIQVDKGSEFYNRSLKSWLEKNDTEMYSIHNERKTTVAEKIY